MVSQIEQWLNYLIPIAIILFFLFLFLSNDKIRTAVAWVGDKLKQFGMWLREKMTGEVVETQQIVYG